MSCEVYAVSEALITVKSWGDVESEHGTVDARRDYPERILPPEVIYVYYGPKSYITYEIRILCVLRSICGIGSDIHGEELGGCKIGALRRRRTPRLSPTNFAAKYTYITDRNRILRTKYVYCVSCEIDQVTVRRMARIWRVCVPCGEGLVRSTWMIV